MATAKRENSEYIEADFPHPEMLRYAPAWQFRGWLLLLYWFRFVEVGNA